MELIIKDRNIYEKNLSTGESFDGNIADYRTEKFIVNINLGT